MQIFSQRLFKIPVSSWTAEQRESIKATMQKGGEGLVELVGEARKLGKAVCVKEHVIFLGITRPEGLEGADGKPFRIAYSKEFLERVGMDDLLSPYPSAEADDGNGDAEAGSGPRNLTILPDQVLKMFTPTFLIRHPALSFPSMMRTGIKGESIEAIEEDSYRGTLEFEHELNSQLELFRWFRSLYAAQGGGKDGVQYPLVLDADDLMDDTLSDGKPYRERLVEKYCTLVGLSPEAVRWKWEKSTEEEVSMMPPIEQRMTSTITASEGVIKGKSAKGLVLEDEVPKWREEFGEDLGARMEGWVKAALGPYEEMTAARLRV